MTFKIARKIRCLVFSDEGVTTTEYAVMLAVIIVACIGAVLTAGDVQQTLFFDTADLIDEAVK